MEKSSTKRLDIIPPDAINTKTLQGGEIDIQEALAQFPEDNIQSVEPVTQTMNNTEVTLICNTIAGQYGIHKYTALNAITEMIRKGGANNVTPNSFTIVINCPQEKNQAEIRKGDILRAIEIHCPNYTFRTLADTLAEDIVKSGISRTNASPGKDFGGDLAKKISIRLAQGGRDPLTPLERVGCASYAQHLPNLNQLTSSNRLSALLAEDLELRRNSQKNKEKKVVKKQVKFGDRPQKSTIQKETGKGNPVK